MPEIVWKTRSNRIEVDEKIRPGGDRWAASGNFQLVLQDDGNLVLYKTVTGRSHKALWASNTMSADYQGNYYSSDSEDGGENHSVDRFVTLQRDGNLVMYDANGKVVWQSGSNGYGASKPFIVIQDDGNVCLYDEDVGGCHWHTATRQIVL